MAKRINRALALLVLVVVVTFMFLAARLMLIGPISLAAERIAMRSAGRDEARSRLSQAASNVTQKLRGRPTRNEGAPSHQLTAPSTPTIFISLSSFRDVECGPTVYDLYDKAKFPHGVFIGAVMQHFDGMDPSCVPHEYTSECAFAKWCPSDNIRSRTIQPNMAKGPTFGRYYGMLLYRGEDYYLQIDSHMRWVKEWDLKLITMYNALPTQKGVISNYPEAWNNPKDDPKVTNAPLDNRGSTMYLCNANFVLSTGYVRLGGFIVGRRALSKEDVCRPQPWASGGFLFSRGSLVTEVPFDPHLPFVFDGEEILYSVRAWTHGYDIFSPSESVLYHYYYRKGAKKFWDILPRDWTIVQQASQRRIQYLLDTHKRHTTERHVPRDTKEEAVLIELDKYGLGTNRTLDQWYEFAGINRYNWTFSKNFCEKYGGITMTWPAPA
jgi:UDP-GlcNAc:polypeptide alpha-N-acetylglucosaminyltransferase